jgi:hypothetical protein
MQKLIKFLSKTFLFWIFASLLSYFFSWVSQAATMTGAVNDIFDDWIATTTSILSWTFGTVIAFIVWVAILWVVISFVLAYVRKD